MTERETATTSSGGFCLYWFIAFFKKFSIPPPNKNRDLDKELFFYALFDNQIVNYLEFFALKFNNFDLTNLAKVYIYIKFTHVTNYIPSSLLLKLIYNIKKISEWN